MTTTTTRLSLATFYHKTQSFCVFFFCFSNDLSSSNSLISWYSMISLIHCKCLFACGANKKKSQDIVYWCRLGFYERQILRVSKCCQGLFKLIVTDSYRASEHVTFPNSILEIYEVIFGFSFHFSRAVNFRAINFLRTLAREKKLNKFRRVFSLFFLIFFKVIFRLRAFVMPRSPARWTV